jgi:NAD(P)H-binding
MKLTIFAATGGIGRLVLEQAVAAGHDVTAVVRNPKKLSSEVRVVRADLASPDPTVLESAVKGADAVISALGAVSASDAGVAWRGTRAIVQAMQATGVRRIIVVSAAPISTVPSPARPNPPRHDPGDGFFMRHVLSPLIKAVLRKHYADLARMEDVLRDSGLDRRATTTADRQGADRCLPHRARAEPPRWLPDLTRRRRSSDAPGARAAADDQAGDRGGVLVLYRRPPLDGTPAELSLSRLAAERCPDPVGNAILACIVYGGVARRDRHDHSIRMPLCGCIHLPWRVAPEIDAGHDPSRHSSRRS